MANENHQLQYDARYVANRISRTVGHVKRVRNMVESGVDCSQVLIQLAAVRGQLDSICGSIMAQHAEQFADAYRKTGDPRLLEEFKGELIRAIKK